MSYSKSKIAKYNQLSKGKIETSLLKEYIKDYRKLSNEVNIYHDVLNNFKKNSLGLILEEDRKTIEYKEAKMKFDSANSKLKLFNKLNKKMSKYYHKHFTYILIENIDIDSIL